MPANRNLVYSDMPKLSFLLVLTLHTTPTILRVHT